MFLNNNPVRFDNEGISDYTLYNKVLYIIRRKNMNREYSPDKTTEKELSENLRFMRSVIEKTHREINPGWPIMVVWGLIIMIGFPALYYLKTNQLDPWLRPIQWLLIVIGVGITIYFGANARWHERKAGLIPRLSKQIYWIWFVLTANATIWICLGLFKDHIGGFGFLLTAIYGIGLSMMGILYSREWLYGGIAIFIGIVAANFTEPYAYYILGIVTGLACIIPAIIAQRNYRKQEKNHE
jgi:hypothetical protein